MQLKYFVDTTIFFSAMTYNVSKVTSTQASIMFTRNIWRDMIVLMYLTVSLLGMQTNRLGLILLSLFVFSPLLSLTC